MRLILFEPDIPQNLGTSLRLCACLGVAADVIEPCGFPFSARGLRRAGMDYLGRVELVRHTSWAAYLAAPEAAAGRLVLLTTHG
jgi:tRNA (cytidine/uridine-2'-O-)-methyltransferase